MFFKHFLGNKFFMEELSARKAISVFDKYMSVFVSLIDGRTDDTLNVVTPFQPLRPVDTNGHDQWAHGQTRKEMMSGIDRLLCYK